jgi:putative transcriptional regulator
MKKEEELEKLGKRIKQIRIEKGMTQVHLAHSINKDQQSVQRLEAGRRNPSYTYLMEVAQGLGVDIADLFVKY